MRPPRASVRHWFTRAITWTPGCAESIAATAAEPTPRTANARRKPTMRSAWGSDRSDAGGMAVPGTPARMMATSAESLISACHANVPMVGGRCERSCEYCAEPTPVTPWHDAQRCRYRPSPSARSVGERRSDVTYAIAFHRWSAVSEAPHAGIAVPRTPTDTTRYDNAGLTPCISAEVPIAG